MFIIPNKHTLLTIFRIDPANMAFITVDSLILLIKAMIHELEAFQANPQLVRDSIRHMFTDMPHGEVSIGISTRAPETHA
jgi:hypothetical protein